MMMALTVWQPWAWAIVAGHKPIENRTWGPFESMIRDRAWIGIHAGARPKTRNGIGDMRATLEALPIDRPPDPPAFDDLAFGAMVGMARIVGLRDTIPPADSPARPWWLGPLAWELADPIMLPRPVPVRGFPKLWVIPEGVHAAMMAQTRGVRP